ncbi:hypothetical protein [Mycolicibacterium komossense]|uniref:Lipoprotein n=1 Tax=Mycolicibacterium komossense TaxID=1779 RepID=A0ABT3CK60_9MYCO|nr:hypothetical protein [Mycolicibacterium komossense]MCV7229752.1 hypothetical protein [Mycolicibacterium komossense]
MSRFVAMVVAALLVLVGCSSGESSSSSSASTSVAPSVVHSTLIDLQLPLGTKISSHADGVEIWKTPGSQADTIAAIKPKLPIGKELKGFPWCSETTDAKTGAVQWRWGGPAGEIDLILLTNGELTIEQTTTPATGCS